MIDDEAIIGATSSDLLAQGQDCALARLVANGTVQNAFLEIGGNDVVFQFAGDILTGNSGAFISTVVANVETAVNTVASAGSAHMIVGNLPDVGATPFFQAHFTSNPVLLQRLTDAIATANVEIEEFAAERNIPVVDLFGLSRLARTPISMGGVQVTSLFMPDGLHPRTALQGLFADTILEAIHVGYHTAIPRLELSDQDILCLAGFSTAP